MYRAFLLQAGSKGCQNRVTLYQQRFGSTKQRHLSTRKEQFLDMPGLYFRFGPRLQEALMCVWCTSHRSDLVAKRFEENECVGHALKMLRRLTAHMKVSTVAQSRFAALQQLVSEEEGGVQKLSFAPQRFISHSTPARVLMESFQAIVSYVKELSSGPPQDQQTQWALSIGVDLFELRSWLILGATADFLNFLKRLNAVSRRSELRILCIESHVETCKEELRKYMRPGNGTFARALKSLFDPPSRNAVKAALLHPTSKESFLSPLHLL